MQDLFVEALQACLSGGFDPSCVREEHRLVLRVQQQLIWRIQLCPVSVHIQNYTQDSFELCQSSALPHHKSCPSLKKTHSVTEADMCLSLGHHCYANISAINRCTGRSVVYQPYVDLVFCI